MTLDRREELLVADLIENALDGEGFTVEETIPGLVEVIRRLTQDDSTLDEVVRLLGEV